MLRCICLIRGSVHFVSSSNSLDIIRSGNTLQSSFRRVDRLVSFWLHRCHDAVVSARDVRSGSRGRVCSLTSGTGILTWSSRCRSSRWAVKPHGDVSRLVIRRKRPNGLPLLEARVVSSGENLEIPTFFFLQQAVEDCDKRVTCGS